ncbi:MAG: hypothetical protein ACN6P8_15735, partial [Achromobacter piechaudii]
GNSSRGQDGQRHDHCFELFNALFEGFHLRRLLLGRRGVGQFGPDAREVVGPQVLAPATAISDQLDIGTVQARQLVAVGDLSQVADRCAALGAARLSFGFWGLPQPLKKRLDRDAGLGMGFCAHA